MVTGRLAEESGSVTPLTLALMVMLVFVTVNLGAGVQVVAGWFELTHQLEQYAIGQAGNALLELPNCLGGLPGVELTGCRDDGTVIFVSGRREVETIWGSQSISSSARIGYGLRV